MIVQGAIVITDVGVSVALHFKVKFFYVLGTALGELSCMGAGPVLYFLTVVL